MSEQAVISSLFMDRSEPVGNIPIGDRRALIVASVNAGVPPDYNNGEQISSSTQDIFKFYKDAVLLKTITLNYTDSTKETLSTWTIV